ncbi:GNAT family N-acetyltransferase [Staphylococcus gallinarum]|jgi:predicted GNAT family N-acyltransferase|uniref:GNAT family N-acetyltransferase n=1 Tax=Staphylococcus gallinarum TaxID=1293 RepID=UPI003A941506
MFEIVINEKMMNDALDIRKEVFVEEQGVPIENEIDEFETIATHIIGYDQHGTPFATARFRNVDNVAKIERVTILKQYRKHGYGKQLMQAIEHATVDEGYDTVKLNAQCHAQAFYESIGYLSYGSVFLEEGIEHITMKKSLK